jgi:hypothetical protein
MPFVHGWNVRRRGRRQPRAKHKPTRKPAAKWAQIDEFGAGPVWTFWDDFDGPKATSQSADQQLCWMMILAVVVAGVVVLLWWGDFYDWHGLKKEWTH